MTERELIAAVRRHAERHYGQNGWDILVECWDDQDIACAIGGATSEMIAVMRCSSVLSAVDEYRSEIMATEW